MSKKSGSSKRKNSRKIVATLAKKLPSEPRVRLSGAKPPAPRNAPKPALTVPAAADGAGDVPKPKDTVTPAGTAPQELKKRELIEVVVARSGVKKRGAKPVIEAMLEVLGDTLGEGREINLQPLGKIKLNRTKETPSARVIVAKIRQNKSGTKVSGKPEETLVDAAE